MNKISCVISCYNESKNLNLLLHEIKKYKLEKDFIFYIINNGSTDNSKLVINSLAKKNKKINFINLNKNLGWGNGILSGLKKTKTNIVGWTHGDLEYSLLHLKKVKKIINSNKIYFENKKNFYIKGYRVNKKLSKAIISNIMGLICSVILGKKLREINAQPFFFHRNEFLTWKTSFRDLSLDMYAFYKLKRKNYLEYRIQVEQKERIYGESSWNKNFFSIFKLGSSFIISAIKLRICQNL